MSQCGGSGSYGDGVTGYDYGSSSLVETHILMKVPLVAGIVAKHTHASHAGQASYMRSPLKSTGELCILNLCPMIKTQFMQKRGVQKCTISAWLPSCFLQVMR